jgi:hypothetical protein
LDLFRHLELPIRLSNPTVQIPVASTHRSALLF